MRQLYEQAEADVLALEEKQAELELSLQQPENFQSETLPGLVQQYEAVQADLAAAIVAWETAADALSEYEAEEEGGESDAQ